MPRVPNLANKGEFVHRMVVRIALAPRPIVPKDRRVTHRRANVRVMWLAPWIRIVLDLVFVKAANVSHLDVTKMVASPAKCAGKASAKLLPVTGRVVRPMNTATLKDNVFQLATAQTANVVGLTVVKRILVTALPVNRVTCVWMVPARLVASRTPASMDESAPQLWDVPKTLALVSLVQRVACVDEAFAPTPAANCNVRKARSVRLVNASRRDRNPDQNPDPNLLKRPL